MNKSLRILRQMSKDDEPYWQEFRYETDDGSATVATALMTLPVTWEHSCLQKKMRRLRHGHKQGAETGLRYKAG